jgi:hypothetical protein
MGRIQYSIQNIHREKMCNAANVSVGTEVMENMDMHLSGFEIKRH